MQCRALWNFIAARRENLADATRGFDYVPRAVIK
jgi:hypothetical protein